MGNGQYRETNDGNNNRPENTIALEDWAKQNSTWEEQCKILGLQTQDPKKHRLCDPNVKIDNPDIAQQCTVDNWEECAVPSNDRVFSALVIPKGTNLYHGTKSNVTSNMILERGNFFGDYNTGSVYNKNSETHVLHRYVVKTPITLIRMDDLDNVILLKSLLEKVPKFRTDPTLTSVRRDLEFAFKKSQINPGKVSRTSDPTRDANIVKFICSLGFSGYASLEMSRDEDFTQRKFHSEVYICNPKKYLAEPIEPRKIAEQTPMEVDEEIWITTNLIKEEQPKKLFKLTVSELQTPIRTIRYRLAHALGFKTPFDFDFINPNSPNTPENILKGIDETKTPIESLIAKIESKFIIVIRPKVFDVWINLLKPPNSNADNLLLFGIKLDNSTNDFNLTQVREAIRQQKKAAMFSTFILGDDFNFVGKQNQILSLTEENSTKLVDVLQWSSLGLSVNVIIGAQPSFLNITPPSLPVIIKIFEEKSTSMENSNITDSSTLSSVREIIKRDMSGSDFLFLKKSPQSLGWYADQDIITKQDEQRLTIKDIVTDHVINIKKITPTTKSKIIYTESDLDDTDQRKKKQK